jgi:hypothetical protein
LRNVHIPASMHAAMAIRGGAAVVVLTAVLGKATSIVGEPAICFADDEVAGRTESPTQNYRVSSVPIL